MYPGNLYGCNGWRILSCNRQCDDSLAAKCGSQFACTASQQYRYVCCGLRRYCNGILACRPITPKLVIGIFAWPRLAKKFIIQLFGLSGHRQVTNPGNPPESNHLLSLPEGRFIPVRRALAIAHLCLLSAPAGIPRRGFSCHLKSDRYKPDRFDSLASMHMCS